MTLTLPEYVVSSSMLVCERVLRERDDVLTAFRIVDAFYVEEFPDQGSGVYVIQAYAIIVIRTVPDYDAKGKIELYITRPEGPRDLVGSPEPELRSRIPGTPGGITLQVQLNLKTPTLGTYFVELFLEGELANRVPITLVPAKDTPARSE